MSWAHEEQSLLVKTALQWPDYDADAITASNRVREWTFMILQSNYNHNLAEIIHLTGFLLHDETKTWSTKAEPHLVGQTFTLVNWQQKKKLFTLSLFPLVVCTRAIQFWTKNENLIVIFHTQFKNQSNQNFTISTT